MTKKDKQLIWEASLPPAPQAPRPNIAPDSYAICESLADEIGDKTLEDLRAFLGEAQSGALLKFCKELLELVNDQYAYRNHDFDADEEAEDPKNKSSDVLPRQNKTARNLMRVNKMDPGSAHDTAKKLVQGPYERMGTRGYFSN
jgi:hypothetical protein